jgi:hypothetical protein
VAFWIYRNLQNTKRALVPTLDIRAPVVDQHRVSIDQALVTAKAAGCKNNCYTLAPDFAGWMLAQSGVLPLSQIRVTGGVEGP